MQEGVQEALTLYLRLASVDTIRKVLELVRGELELRRVPFHFTLDESGSQDSIGV